jgi:hypothetical protein
MRRDSLHILIVYGRCTGTLGSSWIKNKQKNDTFGCTYGKIVTAYEEGNCKLLNIMYEHAEIPVLLLGYGSFPCQNHNIYKYWVNFEGKKLTFRNHVIAKWELGFNSH